MENKYINYSNILNEVYKRTNGDINRFSVSDKLVCHNIMADIKKEWSQFMPVINYFADMDINTEIKKQTEPDYGKLHRLFACA